jgi:hypothetical protein
MACLDLDDGPSLRPETGQKTLLKYRVGFVRGVH